MSKGEFLTTERHFRIFVAESKRLVRLWGINDWRVDFVHERLSGESRAQCRRNATGRACVLALGVVWCPKDGNGDKHYAPTDDAIRQCARHEVAHLLVGELSCLAAARYVTSDEIEAAEEALMRRLHSLLP